jgi:nucleotide-binding universal stress UspA family protein
MSLFPTRILVGVDRSASARYALGVAAELARATGGELHLVHVKSTSSTVRGRPVTPQQGEAMDAEAAALLADAAQDAADRGVEVAGRHVRYGEHVDRVLVQAQGEVDAGLLVVGASQGGRIARSLFSSPSSGSVRRSGGSVLVARAPAEDVG